VDLPVDPHWASALLWGCAATVVLTTVLALAQGLGLTRLNLPYLVGTLFTAQRDRARGIGLLAQLVAGLLFALLYVAAFESWGRATWWLGAALGGVHALAVLAVGMALLPGLHPRMASDTRGPTPNRPLEPPGFLALNYGTRTPLVVLIAHLAYGAVLGAFYVVR
jgi:uncharacterized membrane protein YagU involved in acid resistance